MHFATYGSNPTGAYKIAILVSTIRKDEIKSAYMDRFGIKDEDVIVMDLHQAPGKKKTPVKEIKEYIQEEVYPRLLDYQIQYVVCADPEYFKVLSGLPKADVNLGYVVDSIIDGVKVLYVPNYRSIFYDPPKVKAKIALGMDALVAAMSNTYIPPGSNIIKFAEYPRTTDEIKQWLLKLLAMKKPLAIDIEAFDLKHHKAGIGTITFCWSKSEGIAFPVDYQEIPGATSAPYGKNVRNEDVRNMLREFFEHYMETALYHNAAYDVYVLIYQLFMADILDTEGLLKGMEILMRNYHCTKLITYLATNSCAGNKLGLKEQAQEYAGNYAVEEIKDITLVPLPKLLEYNLVDGLSTWYTFEKRYPQMIADQQEEVYEGLFKDANLDIVQMQLTGMPINQKRVAEVKAIMQKDHDVAMSTILNNQAVISFTDVLNQKWVTAKNAKLKVKRVSLADAKEVFNPNSNPQLQSLLFEFLKLPVLGLTDSKQPSTDGDTIKNLRNHTKDPVIHELLNALMDYNAVNKILTSFIPAMEEAALGPDGWHYLFGNFVLGGTVSGRLSSNSPNLQNLPAKGKYAKLIKSCFQAPPGWIFAGLDFASLEDRISALTTKDPNKLKVYTDGYDGHCLRAFSYFGDQMPDIVDTVESINSIQDKYGVLRGESKAPTFALTYQGTWITLMKNCGFSEEKAKLVERRYHELYQHSTQWVQDKLDQAAKDGYITVAFGLRLRTPLLYQVIRGTRSTPYEAEAEGRTAGNALGQSWCLLNSRAWSEFMGKVRKSEHRLTIRPCAQIHDAGYALIKDDISVVMYMNEHLVKAVNWNEHPDIYHPDVGLGGDLSLFYPSWEKEITISNGASEADVIATIQKAMQP
ncbi:putative DNA polymerase I [Achromobacter phage vB_AxyP_19-32_Axy10]|uniref:Putative DNA polymerase I n=1 Tax=Achromobacter phage vB_AxyP_19-32_Axy10 TaxID=2591041 RepID=A0A514CTW6_9CAUD|nr:DNA polymerase [Achromobacter phage vB_AxyP_19-32_Axy10]QDH83916.1 putative DNA polymerase I [Achromobacter phage vB_AxyP_19-32_Axy10]